MGLSNSSGGGGGSAAVRAGRAFVELFLDTNALYRGMESVKGRLSGAGNFLAKIGGGLSAAGAAAFGPIGAAFTESAYKLDELNKASERLGTTTEALSKLGFAGKFAGLELEDIEAGAKHLEKNLSEAANGSTEAQKKFRQLGLSAKEIAALPLDQQFLAIGDAIDSLANPADKVNAALDLMGKSGSALLPLFKSGLLSQRFGQAEQLGFVASQEKTDQATKFVDSLTLISVSIKKSLGSIGLALFPIVNVVEKGAEKFAEITAQARKFVKENIAIVTIIAAVGAGLIAAGTATLTLALGFKAAAVAVGFTIAAMKVLAAVVLAVASPVGLVVAGIAALGAVLLTQTETGRQFIGETKEGFISLADTARTAFEGINEALNAGDFGLAFKIALTALRLEWAKVVAFWTDKWNGFKGIFVDGWSAAVTTVALILNNLASNAEIVFIRIGEKVGNAFRYIADIVLEAAERTAEALDALDPTDSLQGALQLIRNLRATTGEAVRDAVRAQADSDVEKVKQRQLAIEKELMQAHSREQKARQEARAADAASAREDIAKLEKELKDLGQKAKASFVGPLATGAAAAIAAGIAGVRPTPDQLFGAVKGGFSSVAADRQFGAGDTWQKQVAMFTKKTAENTEATAKGVTDLAAGLRWK